MSSHRCPGNVETCAHCSALRDACEDYGHVNPRLAALPSTGGVNPDMEHIPIKMMSWERFVEVVRMKP